VSATRDRLRRVCGEDQPGMPEQRSRRCTLRNRHRGAHAIVWGDKVVDTWPRAEDVETATALARANGWRVA
jgi:hypothetical protein